MKTQDGVIEGTAREVIAQLAQLPAEEHVRVVVGRPSLSLIGRRLQAIAAANGVTDAIHDELLGSLKQDG